MSRVRKRYPQNRRAEQAATSHSPAKQKTEKRFHRHRLYGEIPLLPVSSTGINGKVYHYWQYDLDYCPPLPPGAVRGNVRNQVYCAACHVPKYFFVDEERNCVQCGQTFIFFAAEQKHWYERLKFHFSSVPIRCPACRKRKRSEKALREQIARARADALGNPTDPAAHLAVTRALVTYHARTGFGKLNEAIAAARKAQKLWKESVEPLYWEAVAQVQAGRVEKARQLLSLALAAPRGLRAGLRQKATALLASILNAVFSTTQAGDNLR